MKKQTKSIEKASQQTKGVMQKIIRVTGIKIHATNNRNFVFKKILNLKKICLLCVRSCTKSLIYISQSFSHSGEIGAVIILNKDHIASTWQQVGA